MRIISPAQLFLLLAFVCLRTFANGFNLNPFEFGTKPVSSSSSSEYPSIFQEADEMTVNSFTVYALAAVRKLSKDKSLGLSGNYQQLPITATKLAGYIEKDRDILGTCKDFQDEEENQLMFDGIKAIQERNLDSDEKAQLLEMNDQNSNKELVYAIAVSPLRKRITVVFRGSVTKKDFLTDVTWWMRDVNNRMKRYDDNQPDVIRVHAGFHDYLFGDTGLTSEEIESMESFTGQDLDLMEGDKISKFDEIMEYHVIPALKKYPGYKLYVTGHSLGAALATMFAFRAASIERKEVPKPVTCISIASPYVGDESYRQAFKLAEQKNLLRHLRISNHKDIVTIGPFVSLRLRFWKNNPSVGRFYKHVGLNLKQFSKGEFKFSYPLNNFFDEWERAWGQSLLTNLSLKYLSNHGSKEYYGRMDQFAEDLKNFKIEELYDDFLRKDK